MEPEIIRAILPTIINHTIAPLTRPMGYALRHKSEVENLRNQLQKLKDKKDSLQNSAAEAIRKGEEIENKFQDWLIRVDKAIGEAHSLMMHGEEQANNGCFIWLCPNLKAQYELGRGAAKEALAIVGLQDEANRLDRISYLPPPQQIVPSSVIGLEGLPSRLSILKEVVDLLKDPDLNMIGVYGLGGVGKTTLVKEVHLLAVREKLFDLVVMTDVSEMPDIKKIQKHIAEVAGLRLDEEIESTRAWRLRERLMKEKRILLILDNIWGKVDLEAIGIPLGNIHKGCKILLTSRNSTVLVRDMGAQQVKMLDALTDEEAKTLFKINAGDQNSNVPPIAADIAEKCGGLPLLLVTIANSLKNEELYAWKDTLTLLRSFDNQELNAKRDSVLESTYDRLPGKEVKYLFLLCALFGRSDVYILDLLKWSMGLGLFKNVETAKDARNRLYTLIDKLKASCLLLDSNEDGYVKIHDIVREVAVSIASKSQQAFTFRDGIVVKEWPNKDVLSLCPKIISLPHCDIPNLPKMLECPEAEVLHLHTDRAWKIPDSVFERCNKLRVLDFRGASLISLPQSLIYLINLHTLCLDGCSLWDISAIGELKKLEILSLASSDIVELPREAEQLTRLRILDLTDCHELKFIPANVISRLSLLEELYMNRFRYWEVEEMENDSNRNVSLAELAHLSRLTTLEIHIPDAKLLPKGSFSMNFELQRFWCSIGQDFGRGYHKTSRMLGLNLHMGMLQYDVKVLLNKTEELHLVYLRGFNNFVCDLDSGGFQALKHLCVVWDSDMQYIINSEMRVPDCSAFPILETLRLSSMVGLEKICCGGVAVGSFSKLRKLSVCECRRLKNLFSISVFKGFSQLQEMSVERCGNMEEIIGGDESHGIDDENQVVEFSKLKKLSVDGCCRLKNLFSISVFKGFSQLQEMRVRHCENMEEIIGGDESHGNDDENQVVEFNQLHSLELDNLPKLRTFCSKRSEMTAEATSASGTPMPLFNEMVHFPNLENLRLSSITCEKIWHDQTFATCSSLTSLIVRKCENLKYLFSYLVVTSLMQLQKLEIDSCNIIEIVEGRTDGLEEEKRMNTKIIFLKLQFLILRNLPNLSRFCNGYSIKCQSLKELLVEKCFALTTIISTKGTKVMDLQRNQHIEVHSLFYKMSLNKLAKLEVKYCDSVKEVFELTEAVGDEALVGLMSSLSEMLFIGLPNLRYICNKDPWGVLDLDNLKVLKISCCNRLKYAFRQPIASHHLQHLYEIEIKDCISMRGLIEKEGADEEPLDDEILFSSLKKITLFNCPTFSREWELRIVDDEEIEQKLTKDELHGSTVAHFNPHKLFPKLEELSLDGITTMMMMMKSQRPCPTTFACQVNSLKICSYYGRSLHFLGRLQNIKEIIVSQSSFKELFQNARVRNDEEDTKWTHSIKKLELNLIRDLKHIWEENSKSDLVLPNLETLKVIHCEDLVNLAPSSASFRNLIILEVSDCYAMINLISAAAAKSMVQLITMKIKDCPKLSQIIADEQQHGTAQEQEDIIIFSKLKTLELIELSSLTSFCLGNYAFTFTSLELVFVQKCPKLRTFCLGVLKTPALEGVQVTDHSFDEKRHWEGDLNATIHQVYLEKEMALEPIPKLSDLPNLNEAFNPPNQLKILKRLSLSDELVVDECGFSSNAITSRVLQPFKSLKVLFVEKCDSAVQLFDFEGLSPDDGHFGLVSQLDELHLTDLPKLRVTWDNDARGILCFKSLKVLKVDNCISLTKIFTLSMAWGLVQLRNIEVKRCYSVEAIVVKDEEQQPTWDGTIFPSLESITLEHLPSLRSIYSGSGVLKFHYDARGILCFKSLKVLKVDNCISLTKIFTLSMAWGLVQLRNIEVKRCYSVEAIVVEDEEQQPTWDGTIFPSLESITLEHLPSLRSIYSGSGVLKFPALKWINVSQCPKMQTHASKAFCKMFPSLEELSCDGKAIPLLRLVSSLNKLRVHKCFLEQLFRYEGGRERGDRVDNGDVGEEIKDDGSCTALPPSLIRNLELSSIHGLKHLWNQGFQFDIQTLKVQSCYDLIDLAPFSPSSSSSESFQNLTTLDMSYCDEMIYLVPSSVAQSMVQLVRMRIESCAKLMSIVADHEQEDDTIREEGEIVFSKLKTLELICLNNLTWFCSDNYTFTFPSLEQVVVETCPKLKIFCAGILRTPKLESILVKYGFDDYLGKSYWEGNPNATIRQLYSEMGGVNGLRELKLSEFPHLKEKWHDQYQFEFLRKLRKLVVDNCELFLNALSLNHLQYLNSLSELGIEKCDSLEQIFGLGGVDPNEGQLELMYMSKLRLIHLPKLRHVWNKNSQEILGFQNLEFLIIHDCNSLTNIFSLSVALGLVRLQHIEIKRCDSVQEIISREGEEEATGTDIIIIPNLKSITLELLPHVLSFYSGSGILDCPFLKKIDVVECPKMGKISSKTSREQNSCSIVEREKRRVCDMDFGNLYFGDKVVITSLEELRVEWNVFMKEIWYLINHQQQFFAELEVIELTHIPDDWGYLPSDFFHKLPNLEKLVLSDALLEVIFPCDSNICEENHPKSLEAHLRELKFSKLPKLKNLLNAQAVPIFENLTTLELWNCDGLVNLMTPSTARSLVHLTIMSVHECGSIQEIIGSEGHGLADDEICFSQLKHLGLHCLPCLASFHSGNHALSFPALVKVIIRECPHMQIFAGVVSAPKLWRIQTKADKRDLLTYPRWCKWHWEENRDEDEWHWEGNVNDTLQMLFWATNV